MHQDRRKANVNQTSGWSACESGQTEPHLRNHRGNVNPGSRVTVLRSRWDIFEVVNTVKLLY